jgi:hypothetical protein
VIASELAEREDPQLPSPAVTGVGGREVAMMAMSRVGVIVALGALLSMLGGQARSNLAEHPQRRA